MKGTHQFEQFDMAGFSSDKDYTVTGVSEWLDYESKRPMGWRIDAVITRDDTKYRAKDGQVISNLYQPQTFKCIDKPDVAVGDIVEPVDITSCTLYGQYRNQISCKCRTVRVVTPATRKAKD